MQLDGMPIHQPQHAAGSLATTKEGMKCHTECVRVVRLIAQDAVLEEMLYSFLL